MTKIVHDTTHKNRLVDDTLPREKTKAIINKSAFYIKAFTIMNIDIMSS